MIRVLIVDDSAVVRQMMTKVLGADPQIEVVGAASDPYVARDMIASTHPDVMTLDLNLPRMDGLTFLRRLMVHYPMPVVVVSSLTQAASAKALEALASGAVDVVAKPQNGGKLEDMAALLVEKVKEAAGVNPRKLAAQAAAAPTHARRAPAPIATPRRLVAIGASTGGTAAIERVLRDLPSDAPPIVIVQHMPAGFTASFAARLDAICKVTVREAKSGDLLAPGLALIAPGDHHLVVEKRGPGWAVDLADGPPVNRHRPAVDALFDSVARHAGADAVGVLLTGMGADGARGLLAMHERGAVTLAQDEATSVVFGMPAEAIALGAADEVVALGEVAARILEHSAGVRARAG